MPYFTILVALLSAICVASGTAERNFDTEFLFSTSVVEILNGQYATFNEWSPLARPGTRQRASLFTVSNFVDAPVDENKPDALACNGETAFLYGGHALDTTADVTTYNDMWQYCISSDSTATGLWRWLGGLAAHIPGEEDFMPVRIVPASFPSWCENDGARWNPSYLSECLEFYPSDEMHPAAHQSHTFTAFESETQSAFLFGGYGRASTNYDFDDEFTYNEGNDLWEYRWEDDSWRWLTPSTGFWEWDTANGIWDPQRYMVGKSGHVAWRAQNRTDVPILLIFGGGQTDGGPAIHDDVWAYNILNFTWTMLLPNTGSGVWNVSEKGSFGPTGRPEPRTCAMGWTVEEKSGGPSSLRYFMFGGGLDYFSMGRHPDPESGAQSSYGFSSGLSMMLNDLWEFSVELKQWKWIAGTGIKPANMEMNAESVGTFRLLRMGSEASPSARILSATSIWWTDDGMPFLFLFGGSGRSQGTAGPLGDAWLFDLTSEEWIFFAGPEIGTSTSFASLSDDPLFPCPTESASVASASSNRVFLFYGYSKCKDGLEGALKTGWKISPASRFCNNVTLFHPDACPYETGSVCESDGVCGGQELTHDTSLIGPDPMGVEVFRYSTDACTATSTAPRPRLASTMWSVDHYEDVVFMGFGYHQKQNELDTCFGAFGAIWSFNWTDQSWTIVAGHSQDEYDTDSVSRHVMVSAQGVFHPANQPLARHAQCGFVDQERDSLYVFGGRNTKYQMLRDLWELDVNRSNWNTTMGQWAWKYGIWNRWDGSNESPENGPGGDPKARSWASCAQIGNTGYFFGGLKRDPDAPDIGRLIPLSSFWKVELAPGAISRMDRLYGDSSVRFDLPPRPKFEWSEYPEGPASRYGAMMWPSTKTGSSDPHLFIFGGQTVVLFADPLIDVHVFDVPFESVVSFNDVWEFNVTSSMWRWVAGTSFPNDGGDYRHLGFYHPKNLPSARCCGGYAPFSSSDGVFLLAGGVGASAVAQDSLYFLSDLWLFDSQSYTFKWLNGSSLPSQNTVIEGIATGLTSMGYFDMVALKNSFSFNSSKRQFALSNGYGYEQAGYVQLHELPAIWRLSFENHCLDEYNSSAPTTPACPDRLVWCGTSLFGISSEVCSGHGSCSVTRGVCECDPKWDGPDCTIRSCFGIDSRAESICGGKGSCDAPDTCNCTESYRGPLCDMWKCGTLFYDESGICNSLGKCVSPDVCACFLTYYGFNCEEMIPGNTSLVSEDTLYIDWVVSFDYVPTSFSCSNVLANPTLADTCTCTFEANSDDSSMTARLKLSLGPGQELRDDDVIQLLLLSSSPVGSPGPAVIVNDVREWEAAKLPVDLIVGISVPLSILLGALGLVGIVLVVILVYCALRRKRVQAKLDELGDVDVLLQERRVIREDAGGPSFSLDASLFVIKYEDVKLMKSLGSGGSGAIVFRGKWKGTDVAMKVFRTASFDTVLSYDMFEKEVRLMSSLSHPNVAKFYGCSLKPPRVGILCEYCALGELKDYFEMRSMDEVNGPVTYEERLRFMQETCAGMSYLHSVGIIHRDLKSENVLLAKGAVIKLIDFGLSRVVDEEKKQNLTMRVGTSYYMAPEITLGRDYSKPIDVFSFSIMLFELLTGNFDPYGTLGNIELRVANDPTYRPVLPDDFETEGKEWLIDLMKNGWSHDPSVRPTFDSLLIEIGRQRRLVLRAEKKRQQTAADASSEKKPGEGAVSQGEEKSDDGVAVLPSDDDGVVVEVVEEVGASPAVVAGERGGEEGVGLLSPIAEFEPISSSDEKVILLPDRLVCGDQVFGRDCLAASSVEEGQGQDPDVVVVRLRTQVQLTLRRGDADSLLGLLKGEVGDGAED